MGGHISAIDVRVSAVRWRRTHADQRKAAEFQLKGVHPFDAYAADDFGKGISCMIVDDGVTALNNPQDGLRSLLGLVLRNVPADFGDFSRNRLLQQFERLWQRVWSSRPSPS